VNHNVYPIQRPRQRLRLAKVGLHASNNGSPGDVSGERLGMVHQTQRMPARDEVAGQQAAKVPRRARDQNRRPVMHVTQSAAVDRDGKPFRPGPASPGYTLAESTA
jgi:hypothetical protein